MSVSKGQQDTACFISRLYFNTDAHSQHTQLGLTWEGAAFSGQSVLDYLHAKLRAHEMLLFTSRQTRIPEKQSDTCDPKAFLVEVIPLLL